MRRALKWHALPSAARTTTLTGLVRILEDDRNGGF
jgi:hypothetical protein